MHHEYPAWVIGEAVPLDPTGHLLYIRPSYQHRESKKLYLIHINKHREAAKTRRQRNMAQMKEQIKTPEKELNEMEISNLSDAEFRTLVIKKKKKRTLIIRMLEELSEDLNSIKQIQ